MTRDRLLEPLVGVKVFVFGMAKAGGYGGRHAPAMSAVCGGSRLGPTFELTGPLRWDGLARVGKMYRVPQTGPRRPAVAGPVVQRGVRPRRGFAQDQFLL